MASERHYTFCVISYASREELQPLLDKSKQWALIKHDKDHSEPHFHIIVTFRQNMTFSGVRKLVVSSQNTLAQKLETTVDDMLDYFTHEGKEDKAQYDPSDIEYSDIAYWNERRDKDCSNEEQARETFLEDLMSDDYDMLRMAKLYGKDFIRNFETYTKFRNIVKQSDMMENEKQSRAYNIEQRENEVLREVNRKLQGKLNAMKQQVEELYDVIRQLSDGTIN